MNELDAIRARRAAITPGVWNVDFCDISLFEGENLVNAVVTTQDADIAELGADEQCHANAAFIAAAPADVDTLLAMVERLTAENAQYKASHEDLIQTGLSLVADRSRFRSAILSLTPGGSEFYDEPERCAEWARERMANAAKLAKERNELRAEVERLTGEVAELDELTSEQSSRYEYLSADLSVAKFQRDQAQRERDAALAELAAERDAAKRHAAYIASCVDECGSYIP